MNSPLMVFGPRISHKPLRRLGSGAETCGKESRGEISRWRWNFSRTSGTQLNLDLPQGHVFYLHKIVALVQGHRCQKMVVCPNTLLVCSALGFGIHLHPQSNIRGNCG